MTYDFDPKPTVVIAEFENRKTIPLQYTSRDLYDFLTGQGYRVFASEWHPISEYGREHKWRRLLSSPVELDPLAWGNFVAIDPRFADALKGVFRRTIVRYRLISPLRQLRPTRKSETGRRGLLA
jgi:hypothetical protein